MGRRSTRERTTAVLPESRATFQDTNGISVSAFSERKDAAKEFARFMTTRSSSKTTCSSKGTPASSRTSTRTTRFRQSTSELLDDMRFNLENAQGENYMAQPQVDDYLNEQITPGVAG